MFLFSFSDRGGTKSLFMAFTVRAAGNVVIACQLLTTLSSTLHTRTGVLLTYNVHTRRELPALSSVDLHKCSYTGTMSGLPRGMSNIHDSAING